MSYFLTLSVQGWDFAIGMIFSADQGKKLLDGSIFAIDCLGKMKPVG